MAGARSDPSSRRPRTRAERQRETREALVLAALDAFARDGYHAASLEGIAADAGFSKGAVYSNFDGKSDLFLAAMDYNLERLRGDDWNPLSEADAAAAASSEPESEDGVDAEELVRGFGLATLEFIASAARDDKLVIALRERVQVMIDAYERIASEARPAGERLPAGDVAQLMAALDQGVSVLALSGITATDGALMRVGLQRLMDPAEASSGSVPERGGKAEPLPDVAQVQRLIREAPQS